MNLDERIEDILSMGVSRQRKAIADLVNEERIAELKEVKPALWEPRIGSAESDEEVGYQKGLMSQIRITRRDIDERIQTLSQGGKEPR